MAMMAMSRSCSRISLVGMHSKTRVGSRRVGVQHHGWYRVPSERVLVTHALGDSKDKDSSNSGLKREDEPEEYWSSERERKGESPFKDPLAIIGIVSILFPFIFLIIASSVGLVDLSPR